MIWRIVSIFSLPAIRLPLGAELFLLKRIGHPRVVCIAGEASTAVPYPRVPHEAFTGRTGAGGGERSRSEGLLSPKRRLCAREFWGKRQTENYQEDERKYVDAAYVYARPYSLVLRASVVSMHEGDVV